MNRSIVKGSVLNKPSVYIIKTHQDTHALSRRETTISSSATHNRTIFNQQPYLSQHMSGGKRHQLEMRPESLNHHLPKSSTSLRSLVVILMNHSQQHAVRFIVNLYIIHFTSPNSFTSSAPRQGKALIKTSSLSTRGDKA